MDTMVSRCCCSGRLTVTVSPAFFPMRARATGEIQLTMHRAGSLSSTPTILYVRFPRPCSSTVTVAPNTTRRGGSVPGVTTSMIAIMRERYWILRSTSLSLGCTVTRRESSSARMRAAPSGVT